MNPPKYDEKEQRHQSPRETRHRVLSSGETPPAREYLPSLSANAFLLWSNDGGGGGGALDALIELPYMIRSVVRPSPRPSLFHVVDERHRPAFLPGDLVLRVHLHDVTVHAVELLLLDCTIQPERTEEGGMQRMLRTESGVPE